MSGDGCVSYDCGDHFPMCTLNIHNFHFSVIPQESLGNSTALHKKATGVPSVRGWGPFRFKAVILGMFTYSQDLVPTSILHRCFVIKVIIMTLI